MSKCPYCGAPHRRSAFEYLCGTCSVPSFDPEEDRTEFCRRLADATTLREKNIIFLDKYMQESPYIAEIPHAAIGDRHAEVSREYGAHTSAVVRDGFRTLCFKVATERDRFVEDFADCAKSLEKPNIQPYEG